MTSYTLVLGKTETDAMPGDTGDSDYKQLRQGREDKGAVCHLMKQEQLQITNFISCW